ncbi:MAG: orotidine-5'-phosphate decarboxylase [Candidatus Aquicultor sp.]
MIEPKERLIIALDVSSSDEVAAVCDRIGDNAVFYKVGLQLFLAEGRSVIELLKGRGSKVFLDLKLHDIPNQVAGACREVVKMGVDMTTIHTMGGVDMMQAAANAIRESAQELGIRPPILLGVTVLTSLNDERAGEIGIANAIPEQVVNLAVLAKKSGLDGIVASPHEVSRIREKVGDDFVIITPGIRSSSEDVQDQKRVMSAGEAISAGSSYLVVGRPVLKAGDPAAAASKIVTEITEAERKKIIF